MTTQATSSLELPQKPAPWRAWLLACRPATLSAAIGPVIVGNALAWQTEQFTLTIAAVTLLVALLIQLGTNLANDYFDYRSGADDEDRLGPPRASQRGWLAAEQIFGAAMAAFVGAAVAGSYLIWLRGWPVVVIGLTSIAAGIAYTGGPLPFGYLGLGDLAAWLFFGPIAVCGTFYAQTAGLSAAALAAATVVGAPITAILVVNNIRDRHTDRKAGKRTLAVRWGLRTSRVEYTALLASALLASTLFAVRGPGNRMWMLVLASIPAAVRVTSKVWRRDGAELNPVLGETARLSLMFCMLLAAGIVLR